MNRILRSFFFLLFCWNASAQVSGVRLEGGITDVSGAELPFATVYFPELNRAAAGDSQGRFEAELDTPGLYRVRVSSVGFLDLDTSVSVYVGMPAVRWVLLERTACLCHIHVEANRTEYLLPQNRLNAQDLAAGSGKSLSELLDGVVGMSQLQTGATVSKPVLHGLSGNRLLLLNNGVRQEGQQWGSEHAPEMDPAAAASLTVVKGAQSLRYGADAIAGVILLEPAPLRPDKYWGGALHLSGNTNGGLLALSARVEQGGLLPGLSWRLQGSLRRAGNYAAPHYMLANTGFAEYNGSFALRWERKKHEINLYYSQFNSLIGIFKGSHIGNLTDLDHALQADMPFGAADRFSYRIDRPAQSVKHHLLKLKYDWNINDKNRFALTAAFQNNRRSEYDLHRAYGDTLSGLQRPALRLDLKTYTVETLWEHRPFAGMSGQLGAAFLFQDNTNLGSQSLIPNYYALNAGLFWIGRYTRNRWALESGLRYDYKGLEAAMYKQDTIYRPFLSFHNLSGSLAFVWTPNSRWNLNLHTGTAWRAPSPNELFSNGVHHGAAVYEIGHLGLRSEKAWSNSLSLSYRLPKRLEWEALAYIYSIRDFIYARPTLPATLTIRGAFPTFVYAQTNALIAGCDARLRWNFWKGLGLETKFALVRGYDARNKDFLPGFSSDRWENSLHYEYFHSRPDKALHRIFASVSLRSVFRQTHTAAVIDYAPPPAGYHLLGLRAGAAWQKGKLHCEASLEVSNLLNTRYRDYLDRFRYFADTMGRSFWLRLNFRFGR